MFSISKSKHNIQYKLVKLLLLGHWCVYYRWMESGKSSEIKSIDLDGSDNLSEAVIKRFIDLHHDKLEGLVLTGMGQISDMLFITELPKTKVN